MAALAHLFVPEGADLADWFAEHGVAVLEADAAAPPPACSTPPAASRSWWWSCPRRRSGRDGIDPATLPRARPALDDGVGWGLYRLDFTATPDS